MRLFSAALRGWVSPADAFIVFFADEINSFWLDRETHPTERFSVIGASTRSEVVESASFDWLGSQLADLAPVEGSDTADLPFDFRPGLVGLVDYESKAHFMHIDRAVVFDHAAKRMYFIGFFESQESFDLWHHSALLRLGLVAGQVAAYQMAKSGGSVSAPSVQHSQANYLSMIETAQKHISAGDVYQICLTNQIRMSHNLDPLSVFLRLRASNPAPYATYLQLGELKLVSTSPEMFLKADSAGRLSTMPIKGTRPRSSEPELDKNAAKELGENLKERAENLMIVDLMRNDLGRVSEPGSIEVSKLFEVESYATVHQLVSTVQSQLATGQTSASALLAAFPGGSMTGAPKIRAMQIIETLEGCPRGAYSGAIGYFGFDGSAEFAMTIRSIVFSNNELSIGVGGGITSDSEPQAEFEEIRLKARALLEALEAPDPWANR